MLHIYIVLLLYGSFYGPEALLSDFQDSEGFFLLTFPYLRKCNRSKNTNNHSFYQLWAKIQYIYGNDLWSIRINSIHSLKYYLLSFTE